MHAHINHTHIHIYELVHDHFQASKVRLQHLKIHRISPTLQFCYYCSLHTKFFHIITIKYSYLIDDNCQFIATARDRDQQNTSLSYPNSLGYGCVQIIEKLDN